MGVEGTERGALFDQHLQQLSNRYLRGIAGTVGKDALIKTSDTVFKLLTAMAHNDDEGCKEQLDEFKRLHAEILRIGNHDLSDPGNGMIAIATHWWESRNGQE